MSLLPYGSPPIRTTVSGNGNINFVASGGGITIAKSGRSIIFTVSAALPGGADTQVQFNDGNAFNGVSSFTIDKTNGFVGIGGAATARLQLSGAISAASWTTAGINLKTVAATYTNTSTAAAGTVAVQVANAIGIPTFASTNAITVTTADTFYIAGAPVAGTNTTIVYPLSLHVAAGTSAFGTMVTSAGMPASTAIFIAGPNSLRFGSNDGNAQYGVYMKPNFSGSSNLIIGSQNNGTETPMLTLNATGFRIGTDGVFPSKLFAVHGTGYDFIIDPANGFANQTTGTTAWANFGTTSSTDPIAFYDSTNTLMGSIGAAGRAGFGVAHSATYYGSFGTDTATAGVRINTASNANGLMFAQASTDDWLMYLISNDLRIRDVVASADTMAFKTGSLVGIGTTSPTARFHISGNMTAAAWGLNGIQSRMGVATYTDSSTAQNGTAATAVANAIAQPTFNSSNTGVTISDAATFYIADAPTNGANVTLTRKYPLWIDAGLPRIDSTTANGSVATVLGSVGPVGSNTTVQEWLTVNINGTTRYIPCF